MWCSHCKAAWSGYPLISPKKHDSLMRTGSEALAVVHRCVDTLLAVPFIGTDGALSSAASSDTRSAAALHPVRLSLEAPGDRSEARTQGSSSDMGVRQYVGTVVREGF